MCVRHTSPDISLADFQCCTLVRIPFHFGFIFWWWLSPVLATTENTWKYQFFVCKVKYFFGQWFSKCDPKTPDGPRPLTPQAIHEVKTLFLTTQRHVYRFHCVVSRTDDNDDNEATVSRAAGALHESRQRQQAVLVVIVFFTTEHWGVNKSLKNINFIKIQRFHTPLFNIPYVRMGSKHKVLLLRADTHSWLTEHRCCSSCKKNYRFVMEQHFHLEERLADKLRFFQPRVSGRYFLKKLMTWALKWKFESFENLNPNVSLTAFQYFKISLKRWWWFSDVV